MPSDGEQGWEPVTDICDSTFSVTIGDGSVVLQGRFELVDAGPDKAIDWCDESGPYDGGERPRAFRTGRAMCPRCASHRASAACVLGRLS